VRTKIFGATRPNIPYCIGTNFALNAKNLCISKINYFCIFKKRKMKLFAFLFLGLTISYNVYAQDTTFVFKPANEGDSLTKGVVYIEDERTDALLRELRTYEVQGDIVIMDGYRIQIYFSNDRKLAEEQRMKFIRMYPQLESFIEYDAPNYTVKVGSFRTMEEAEDFRRIITQEFPMSIIQKTKIKMPLDKGTRQ
jgi:hypothetical protein